MWELEHLLLSVITIYPRAPISKYTEAKTKKYLIQYYVSIVHVKNMELLQQNLNQLSLLCSSWNVHEF